MKRHRIAEWIKRTKQDPVIYSLQILTLALNTHRLKVKEWKKILQANGNPKKAKVAVTISDKIDFKLIMVKRNEVII